MKILKFYADWCGPCRMMAPIVEKIANSRGIELESIDTESEEGKLLAKQYEIASLPTFVIEQDGEIAGIIKGAIPEKAFINKLDSFEAN